MSNKEYFEKLLKDLEYIQENPRGVQAFSNKVAHPMMDNHKVVEAELMKEADTAATLDWLGKAFTNLGNKIDKNSVLKAEKAAAKASEALTKQIAGAKSREELEALSKALKAFRSKFPHNSKAGELAGNILKKLQGTYRTKLLNFPKAAEATEGAAVLVKKILQNFAKGGLKNASVLAKLEPALMRLGPKFLFKLAGMPFKLALRALGAIPGMQAIWVGLAAYEIMDMGFTAAEWYQEMSQKKDMDSLTGDPAALIVNLFRRNGQQPPDANQMLQLVEKFKDSFETAKKDGKLDDAGASQQAIDYVARLNSLKQMPLAQLKGKFQAPTAAPTGLKDEAIKLFQINPDPVQLRKDLIKKYTPQPKGASLSSKVIHYSQLADVGNQEAMMVLNDVKRFEALYTSIGGKPFTSEQRSAMFPGAGASTSGQAGTLAVHEIKSGDTLSQIAVNYRQQVPGLTWMDIAKHNPETIKNPNDIRIGTKINIPNKALNAPAPTGYAPVNKKKEPTAPGKQEVTPYGQWHPDTPPVAQPVAPDQNKPTNDFGATKNEIETVFSDQGAQQKDPAKQKSAANEMSKHLQQTAGKGNPQTYATQLHELYSLNVNQNNEWTDGEKKLKQIFQATDREDPLGVATFISAYGKIVRDNRPSQEQLEKDVENLKLIKTYLEHCELVDETDKIARFMTIIERTLSGGGAVYPDNMPKRHRTQPATTEEQYPDPLKRINSLENEN
jgi:nucleoid-associated protein YgaU